MLKKAVNFPIFQKSDYLQDFLTFAQKKQTKEEQKQREVIEMHYAHKLCLEKHNVQIGKLKGNAFLIGLQKEKIPVFLDKIATRISVLNERLAELDI